MTLSVVAICPWFKSSRRRFQKESKQLIMELFPVPSIDLMELIVFLRTISLEPRYQWEASNVIQMLILLADGKTASCLSLIHI